ncbi:MAG: branched-chain amino acid transferase [Desulfobacterales bacterium]|nr:aminotransferase class IV [Deltaproteobacteria bacterium]NNL74831.1 branched-chain amino acid transferase [Desulfobacterales bacterium]
MVDFSNGAAYIGGQMLPIDQAKISILDWGFLHSDATYDVAHVWKGKFFRLDDHIDRFFSGMSKLRMSIPHSRNELHSIMVNCVRASGLRKAYVEMICTRGTPKPGSRDPRTCTNRFYAFAIPFVWIATPEKQANGLHLIVSRHQRIPPESVDPTVKNYHWLDLVMGLFEAYDRGGETTVLVDHEDNLVEGPGFNIFSVKRRSITTPDRGVLEGITRRTVMELAIECGFKVALGHLAADKVRTADEVFATSTAGGILPITKIDGQTIGSGIPGPVTKELQKRYWALHEDPQYTIKIDYT